MTCMTRPPFIVSTRDVPEKPGRYPDSEEILSFGRAIGRAAGLERIGLHVERLPPGHRTSWPHAEETEEEFVYVLEGEVDAWIDGDLHRMAPGDLAAFPAGTGISHTLLNQGPREARLLVGGERTKPDNRIFYPLHPVRRAQLEPREWWHDVPARTLGPHDGVPHAPADDRPTLRTERLVLRPFRMEDAADVQRLAGDPAIADTTLVIPHPYPIEAATGWIALHAALWATRREVEFAVTKDGALVGALAICIDRANEDAEVGYWIGKPFWGSGYATEALRAALEFSFGPLGLARVHADHFTRNPASGRVLDKAGMTRIGLMRASRKKGDRREDCVAYEAVGPRASSNA